MLPAMAPTDRLCPVPMMPVKSQRAVGVPTSGNGPVISWLDPPDPLIPPEPLAPPEPPLAVAPEPAVDPVWPGSIRLVPSLPMGPQPERDAAAHVPKPA